MIGEKTSKLADLICREIILKNNATGESYDDAIEKKDHSILLFEHQLNKCDIDSAYEELRTLGAKVIPLSINGKLNRFKLIDLIELINENSPDKHYYFKDWIEGVDRFTDFELISEKVIVLVEENRDPILFFPEAPANHGNILSYSHVGQHSEASSSYYDDCRKAESKAEINSCNDLISEWSDLASGDPVYADIVDMDTSEMMKSRWSTIDNNIDSPSLN